MAILKITDELISSEYELLNVLSDYFDSMEEITREYPGIRRYWVQKEGIPNDNTTVICTMKRDGDSIYVDSCKIC